MVVVLFCVLVVGAVFCLFCLFLDIPLRFCSFAFDAQGRHLSKTVTIVMMSAAQEQKKHTKLIGMCVVNFWTFAKVEAQSS